MKAQIEQDIAKDFTQVNTMGIGKEMSARSTTEGEASPPAAAPDLKAVILKTLKEHDWNISKTAHALGIERSHLHRKIKSYGILAAES